MKKSLIIAGLACVALAACTKNEVVSVAPDQEITFQTAINKASTRALISSTAYPTDVPFGTFAYFYPNTFGTETTLYINNAEVKNATSATSGSAWTTTPAYYWPKNGKLTFYSYSPYSISSEVSCESTTGLTITNHDVNANQTVDVMVADRIDNQTANGANVGYTGVPTIFRHKLAQIVNITFKTDKNYKAGPIAAGSKQFFINQVDIKGVKQQATYTSGKDVDGTHLGSWSTATGSNDYVYFKEATSNSTEFTNTATELSGKQLIMPQTLSDTDDTKFVIKYTIRTYSSASASAYSDDVVTVEVPLYNALSTSHAFAMNKKYTFNFTIGLDQIYWAPSVVEWETDIDTISF